MNKSKQQYILMCTYHECISGVQKEHTYLYFEIFYGGQKLHEYFHSFLIKDSSLLTC